MPEIPASPTRDPFVDYLRAAALLSVLLYHVGALAYGHLGVDLFFVLSGYLVSRPLVDALEKNRAVDPLGFVARRAVKIWPSYFAFLLLGGALASALYARTDPSHPIPAAEWPRYLLFFVNYRGAELHWPFTHIWSLCVEEHFYLLLPAAACLVRAKGARFSTAVAAMIAVGWLGRQAAWSTGTSPYYATHCRLDALAWGVALRLLSRRREYADWAPWRLPLGLLGGAALAAAISLHASSVWPWFNAVAFPGIVAFSFFLILGSGGFESKWLSPLRAVARVSYNWYLWHLLFIVALKRAFPDDRAAFAAYLVSGFAVASAATFLVEEPVMRRRDALVARVRAAFA